jgi:signal transduction histidine kinase
MLSELDNSFNFIYIGEIHFDSSDSNSASDFEIFCRTHMNSSNERELNFVFIDITRSKLSEKIKTELKFKTLFFSKVAHELKNPLICINELSRELRKLQEDNPNIFLSPFSQNVNQIKAMSDYLILLVKDLDYFSESQSSLNQFIHMKEVYSNDLVSFVGDIADSLIKRYNRKEYVKLNLIKDSRVPKVFWSDELRLKQILVNLISNAIKFTINGYVDLVIAPSQDMEGGIKFLVKDSGIGLSDDTKKRLFQPYQKGSFECNILGAGLGLFIAADLTRRLGSQLDYDTSSKGTSFWFTLPCKTSSISLSSGIESNSFESMNSMTNSPKTITLNSPKIQPVLNIQSRNSQNSFYNANKILRKIKNKFDSDNDISKKYLKSPSFSDKNIEQLEQSSQSHFIIKIPELFTNKINLLKKNSSESVLNFIVADDENIMRLSYYRILKDISKKYSVRINLIESEDGIETLFAVYKCLQNGIKIDLIFSDETMNFLVGSRSAKYVNELLEHKNIIKIPFCSVSAYDVEFIEKNKKLGALITKPISKMKVEDLLKNMKLLTYDFNNE